MLKKKVILAINNLGIGGAEHLVVAQANILDRARFEPYLVTILKNPERNIQEKIAADVPYRQFAFSSLLDASSWWRLYRYIRGVRPEAVVTGLFNTNMIVRTIAVLLRVPTIISWEHNIYEDKHRWQIMVDRLLARFTKKIVVGSAEVLEFTRRQENIPREKIELIYNSIPLQYAQIRKERDRVLAEFGLPLNRTYLVTAGRLIEQKGHRYLIEAAEKLRARGVAPFTLLIFGNGVLENELRAQISSLGLHEWVRLMGMSGMDKILAISDIFVFPSLWEGLSIALLSAMDAGSPIVATDISGSREAIINELSGLVVPPKEAAALAEALSRLMADGELRERVAAGARRRVRQFSIEENVKKLERLLSV